uniref:Magnesium transporter MgtE intracellular domain-containing protein n=1 Tax=Candidatus Desulfatibia profunda TaxID=2841695 RepID=A0A8J6NKN6_9BACT|nr:hypothetical protein [Candidatus Desulfatibia profunda]
MITVKLILGAVVLYRVGLDSLFVGTNAIASELQANSKDAVALDAKEIKEEKIDINFLIMKKAALEEEEKRLAKKEAELMVIQKEINNKIENLTRLRNEIRSEIAAKNAVEDQKLKHLIKVYSAMKPQNAAGLIEKLDKKLAIELLSKMKGEDVGKILSYVNIEKATLISEGLAKRE